MAAPPTKRGARRPVQKFASAVWIDFVVPDLSHHFRGVDIDVAEFTKWLERRIGHLQEAAASRALKSQPGKDAQALKVLAERARDIHTWLAPEGLPMRADMHLGLAYEAERGQSSVERLRQDLECLERSALTAHLKVAREQVGAKAGARSKSVRDELIADMIANLRKHNIKLAAAKAMTLNILRECGIPDLPLGEDALKKARKKGGKK